VSDSWLCSLLTVVLGCLTVVAAECQSRPEILVFSLQEPGATGGDVEEWDDPNVAGISWRFRWKTLEPREGRYDWASVDEVLRKTADAGKLSMVRVVAGQRSPKWVYEAGAKPFEFTRRDLFHPQQHRVGTLKMPLPWDDVYLEKWMRFIDAFGKRYNGREGLYSVHMSGGGRIGEMNLPKNKEDWRSAGYTHEKLIAAWKKIIKGFRKALPDTPTNLAVNRPLGKDSEEVVERLVDYVLQTYPGKVYLQQNGLKAGMSLEHPMRAMLREAAQKTTVGYQMVGGAGWLGDVAGDPASAIDLAKSDGASYVEVYARDLREVDLGPKHKRTKQEEP
jgi:hypothetical protein